MNGYNIPTLKHEPLYFVSSVRKISTYLNTDLIILIIYKTEVCIEFGIFSNSKV